MAFPQTPLTARVDLFLGGAWVNVTSDALARDQITIKRGRADWAAGSDPATCDLTFKNTAGRYSPRNPRSPYYGQLGRNTPLRVGVGTPPQAAAVTGLTGTSLAAPSVTAEAAGTLYCVWAADPVGNLTVPAGFVAGTERDGTLTTFAAGSKTVSAAGATGTATATYSTAATAACAVTVWVPGGSSGITGNSGVQTAGAGAVMTIAVNAGDYILAFTGWTADPYDEMADTPQDDDPAADWMTLADTGPGAGPRLKALVRRANVTGNVTLTQYGRFPGADDTFVRTWVIPAGVATDYFCRFSGEVSSWPAKWDLSGNDVYTPVQASGITRRLGQGSSPLHSALRREFGRLPALVAYWPCEDGADARAFGSASGGPSMQFVGTPAPAADSSFVCSDPIPTFQTAGARGVVPRYTSTGEYAVGALLSIPATGMTDGTTLFTVSATGGTIATWLLRYAVASGSLNITAVDTSGAILLNANYGPWTPSVPGSQFYLYMTAAPSGADVAWSISYVPIQAGVPVPNGAAVSGTLTAATAGRVSAVTIGDQSLMSVPATIGHVVVVSSATGLFRAGVWQALTAWQGEAAIDRLVRLCKEEGISFHNQNPAATPAMGPQLPKSILDLLRECEDVDAGGVLHEPRGFLGLAYRTRTSKYNQI